jgi:hypothetical protein
MKFKIQVKSIGNPFNKDHWWETYEKDVEDAEKEAIEMVDRFNESLREGEFPRRLLKVEVIDNHSIKDHDWEKINLVTIKDKNNSLYDIYKCRKCLITGKRFGLNPGITIDYKYRAKVYKRCDTAVIKLKENHD